MPGGQLSCSLPADTLATPCQCAEHLTCSWPLGCLYTDADKNMNIQHQMLTTFLCAATCHPSSDLCSVLAPSYSQPLPSDLPCNAAESERGWRVLPVWGELLRHGQVPWPCHSSRPEELHQQPQGALPCSPCMTSSCHTFRHS